MVLKDTLIAFPECILLSLVFRRLNWMGRHDLRVDLRLCASVCRVMSALVPFLSEVVYPPLRVPFEP